MEEPSLMENQLKPPSVLISGGSGLIGKYLTSILVVRGYNVSHLSRSSKQSGNVRLFYWEPEKGIIDTEAFEGIDHIVHLAGANIGKARWTKKRKEEIVNSRMKTTGLLFRGIIENDIKLKTFISASAAGYYGSISSEKIFTEKDLPANDFLGTTCRKWEEAADKFMDTGIRTVKIRTAVVLDRNDSALSKLMMPAKSGFLVQTGSGRQYMPWIHIDDLCNIYLKAIEDQDMNGAYNAVSPQNVTHKEFVETLARVMGKPLFPVPVPAFVIRAVLGKMSDVLLSGSRISSEKIVSSGFKFRYPTLEGCLRSILLR